MSCLNGNQRPGWLDVDHAFSESGGIAVFAKFVSAVGTSTSSSSLTINRLEWRRFLDTWALRWHCYVTCSMAVEIIEVGAWSWRHPEELLRHHSVVEQDGGIRLAESLALLSSSVVGPVGGEVLLGIVAQTHAYNR